MKTIKKMYAKVIWGLFSAPRHAADWAAQNEWRIGVLIYILFIATMFGLLFGYLPSVSFVR